MPQENLQSKSQRGAKLRPGWGKEVWFGTGLQTAKAEVGPAVHQPALEVCHNHTGPQRISEYNEGISSSPNEKGTKVT